MPMPPNASWNSSEKGITKFFQLFSFALRIAVLLGLFALLLWGWRLYKDPQFMPVQHVKIVATNEKVDKNSIVTIISAHTTQQGLLSLNIEGLKEDLLQNPWVYQVIVKRVWPNEIEVIITEQKAVAIWNNSSLLNAEGDIFSPPQNTFPANLPNLNSPPLQQKIVLQTFNQFNQALAAYHLAIAIMTLNSRGSWQMVLNNGIKITLGRLDPEQRFARFIAAYPTIFASQIQNIASIDLRYPDGIAVGWKTMPHD